MNDFIHERGMEISIFKPRVIRECVHWLDGNGQHPNVMAVQFLDTDSIEFYCENCIEQLKKNGFKEKKTNA